MRQDGPTQEGQVWLETLQQRHTPQELSVDHAPHGWAADPSLKRGLGGAPLCSPHQLILWESNCPRALTTLWVDECAHWPIMTALAHHILILNVTLLMLEVILVISF